MPSWGEESQTTGEIDVIERIPTLDELQQGIKDLIQAQHDKPRIVNEYKTSSLVPDSEQLITLQPQFARMPVRIDQIVVMGPSISDASTIQLTGNVTTPAANTTIVSAAAALIPGMTYVINWSVGLDGTVAAADGDNFQLRFGSSTLLTSSNAAAVGRYPQEPVTVTIPAGGSSIVLRTGNTAGTTGAIYTGTLSITPVGYTVTVQLGDHIWPNLVLPSTGVLTISVKCLILQPRDLRQLFANVPAQYYFGLFGFADVRTDIR